MDRADLLRSLDRQHRLLSASVVLTPVDSNPFRFEDRARTAFLHGLYLTDKVRSRKEQKGAIVQFSRRNTAARDIDRIYHLFAERLGASHGSLRLLSGLHAQASTFMSIGSAGQTVALLPEGGGGHFSTDAILRRLGYLVVELPLDDDRMCVDRTAAMELMARAKPDFLLVDRSEGLSYEDFEFLGKTEGPVKVFDASQYLPQIMTGRYSNPLSWGFDLMLFSLHKSFPGPQKAGIVAREGGEIWKKLMAGLSTFVSSSHAENTYLAGLVALEDRALEQYVDRMLGLAESLASELAMRGVPVVPRGHGTSPDWPATQHIWIASNGRDDAFSSYEDLARIRVHTNYRKLPYKLGYGLRLGTTFAAATGFCTEDAPPLADLVADALERGPSPKLRHGIRELAENAAARTVSVD